MENNICQIQGPITQHFQTLGLFTLKSSMLFMVYNTLNPKRFGARFLYDHGTNFKGFLGQRVDDLPLDIIPDLIGNYDICVVKTLRLNADLIARATRMKLIMQYGVGIEGIDIAAATNCGIKVARIPSGQTGNAASCVEMAIYLMLGLLRKQNEMQIAVREMKVGEPMGDTLLGKTVFIMGYGNIGIELAKRLRPFGVKVIATKRNWASVVPNKLNYTEPTSQNNALGNLVDVEDSHEDIYEFAKICDIVVCCLRMNSETVHFFPLLHSYS
ncbi:uncharacterized protein [Rutidosis leptorrhynchoides]|uniref:uncharacterized protein n=1 Tax=Rutidosis leptorrhynchoides TaxID=125765 RepID=UPI003A9A01F4